MLKNLRPYLLWFSALTLPLSSLAQEVTFTKDKEPLDFYTFCEYWQGDTLWAKLDSNLVIKAEKDYRFRFSIANNSGFDSLAVSFGKFDVVEIYDLGKSTPIATAGLLKNHTEEVERYGRLPAIIYLPKSSSKTFEVKIRNTVRQFNNKFTPQITSLSYQRLKHLEFYQNTKTFDWAYIFFLGGIFVFFFYALTQFFNLSGWKKEETALGQNTQSIAKAYLFYALYLFGVFFYYLRLAEAGGAITLLFAYNLKWYYFQESPLGLLSIFFYVLFLHDFLNLSNRTNGINLRRFGWNKKIRLSSLFKWSAYAMLVGIPVGFLAEQYIGFRFSYSFYFFLRTTGVLVAFVAVAKIIGIKDKFVRIAIIGSSFLIVTGLASILDYYFSSEQDFSTFNDILFFSNRNPLEVPILWMNMGIFIEVVFYAWALSLLTKEALNESAKAAIQVEKQKAELEKQQIELENQKAKEDFYQNITHEFKTPLTIITGLTNKLREDIEIVTNRGYTKDLNLIQRSANSLLRLVNQLLDFTRLQSKQLPLEPINADIVKYLSYLVESFESMASLKQIKLQKAISLNSREIFMDYDPKLIEHIVANLLQNAIKFTEKGGTITFYINKIEADNLLEIKVEDTGVGIKQENLDRIFQKGYTTNGSGIGLAFVKEIIDLLEGKIEVESTENEGSCFSVYLTITNQAEAKEIEIPTNNPNNLEIPAEVEEVGPASEDEIEILLVEDNKDVIYVLKHQLKGFKIATAENGIEGLEKAIETIPQLIISDVMMPEMDGFELCVQLKNNEATDHIPIILLTADHSNKLQGLELGAIDYIIKPPQKEELLLKIKNLIANQNKLKERNKNIKSINELSGFSDHTKTLLIRLEQFIEDNLADPAFKVPYLARLMGMSVSKLNRKLNAIGIQNRASAGRYIKSYRLTRAKEFLKNKDKTILEVAFSVGYQSNEAFTDAFSSEFKQTPSEYRSNS